MPPRPMARRQALAPRLALLLLWLLAHQLLVRPAAAKYTERDLAVAFGTYATMGWTIEASRSWRQGLRTHVSWAEAEARDTSNMMQLCVEDPGPGRGVGACSCAPEGCASRTRPPRLGLASAPPLRLNSPCTTLEAPLKPSIVPHRFLGTTTWTSCSCGARVGRSALPHLPGMPATSPGTA
jgi:hypothetical protein